MAAEVNLWAFFSSTVFFCPSRELEAWGGTAFYILTAYNPGGVARDEAANLAADLELQTALAGWERLPLAGSSPCLTHREEGWAVRLPSRQVALEFARLFGQRAIYEVCGDELRLIDAEGRMPETVLGCFSTRLRWESVRVRCLPNDGRASMVPVAPRSPSR